MDDSWPYKGKTNYRFPHDQGYQYRGYFLDKEKRPTFMYQYGEIAVEDFFEDLLDDDGKAYFRRTLTLTAPADQEPFYFRVASGKKIERAGEAWKIDKLELRLASDYSGQVRDGDPQELLLPLTIPKGKTVLQLEYQW